METCGWRSLVSEHAHLLAEAFKALATQHTPPTIMFGPPRKRAKQSSL